MNGESLKFVWLGTLHNVEDDVGLDLRNAGSLGCQRARRTPIEL